MINNISLDHAIDVGTSNVYPWDIYKIYYLDNVLMYLIMSAMYCACMHTVHSV